MKKQNLKAMPSLKCDEEAEKFVESADLSGFVQVKFEFEPKTATLNMRLLQRPPAAVKIQAEAEGDALHTLYSSCFGTGGFKTQVICPYGITKNNEYVIDI